MEPSEALTENIKRSFFTQLLLGVGIFYRERELLLPELDMPVRKVHLDLKLITES